jgi:hypothetical protein
MISGLHPKFFFLATHFLPTAHLMLIYDRYDSKHLYAVLAI